MWDVEGADQLADKIDRVVQFVSHSTKDRISTFVALTAAGLTRLSQLDLGFGNFATAGWRLGVNRHAKGTPLWSAPLRVDSLSS
jgi:hypothetical protein